MKSETRKFEIIGSQSDRDRLEKMIVEKGLSRDDLALILKTVKPYVITRHPYQRKRMMVYL